MGLRRAADKESKREAEAKARALASHKEAGRGCGQAEGARAGQQRVVQCRVARTVGVAAAFRGESVALA